MSSGISPISAARQGLRFDLKKSLEDRLQGQLGDRFKANPQAFEKILNEAGKIDLGKLDPKDLKDLEKLQQASEGLEAIFIKDILGRMRRSGFGEKPSPMEEQIKDWMDSTMAETASQSPAGMGLAKTIFLDSAQRVVNQAASGLPQATKENHV